MHVDAQSNIDCALHLKLFLPTTCKSLSTAPTPHRSTLRSLLSPWIHCRLAATMTTLPTREITQTKILRTCGIATVVRVVFMFFTSIVKNLPMCRLWTMQGLHIQFYSCVARPPPLGSRAPGMGRQIVHPSDLEEWENKHAANRLRRRNIFRIVKCWRHYCSEKHSPFEDEEASPLSEPAPTTSCAIPEAASPTTAIITAESSLTMLRCV